MGVRCRVEGAVVVERAESERDRRVEALFDRNYASMCRLAYLIVGDAGVAEEIVMEALLKTWSGWSRIRDVDAAEGYLRRAVVNLCRSRIRRKVIEARVNQTAAGLEERRPPLWDPERHETSRLVWAAVTRLPPRQKTCVVLRYYEDLPEAEIAQLMGSSVGTVKSQLAKARAKLEAALRSTSEELA